MGRVSILIYLTVAIVLLLVISRSSDSNRGLRHRHRLLKLRSNFTFTPPATPHHHRDRTAAFDPLVADIELKREDKEWEQLYFETHHPELSSGSTQSAHGMESSEPEWEDFMNAEDYLNNEERFNVTNRLVLLFPKIDVGPPDGYVSESELTEWYLQQSQREVLHRTEREMEVHDKNKDGFLSFEEYDPPSWVKNSDNNSFGYDMGWWKKKHFNASDADGDGLLNITEFNDFLHPADTTNPSLRLWLCQEEIRERDSDRDGKLNFREFFLGLFDLVRSYDEQNHTSQHETEDSAEAPAKPLFSQLDKDGDGFLSDEELLPVIGQIHPSELYYAKQQTEYIMQQGYVIYSVRKKLRKQFMHLKGKQIEKHKKSGVEATFSDENVSIEQARQHGHTHLFEIMEHAQWIRNKTVVLTHFSSCYHIEDVRQAVSRLQSNVSSKWFL